MSTLALGPTRLPMQWLPGIEQLGFEAEHTKVKNEWSYTSTPPIHLHGMVLSLKAQGQLYFYFTFKNTNS